MTKFTTQLRFLLPIKEEKFIFGKKFHIILNVEGISDRRAIKLLMKEFENHPYIMQAEIRYGGIWKGQSERRNFSGERVFEKIPQRIIVQQFETKFLDNQGIKDRIKSLKLEIKELQDYVGAN